MDMYTATEVAFKNGYNKAKEDLKGFVVLDKDEYECLKKEASMYDPAPWCKPGICEGISKTCKDTCPDSVYTKIREEVIVDFLVSTGGWTVQEATRVMKQFMNKKYNISYEHIWVCQACGRDVEEGQDVCDICADRLKRAIQNT